MTEQTSATSRRQGILLATFLAIFLPVLFIELGVMKITNAVFMYPLDDVFIHMEIASHLASEATWGINSNAFGSASSSPLYTLLLAGCFLLFSTNTLVPFIINCLAAAALLVVLHKALISLHVSAKAHLCCMLAIVFFTPLPILVVSGMEHTLQCLFVFLFLQRFSTWVIGQESPRARGKARLPVAIFIYAALVTFIRYEGLFLIAAACLLLLWHKKIMLSFQLGLFAAAPLIVFGLISLSKGSYPLPNSLLVKSDSIVFSLSGLVHFASTVLIDKLTIAKGGITSLATQRLLLILPLALFFCLKVIPKRTVHSYSLLLLILCTLLHLAFATTGWFYRYEAYLMLCSVYTVSMLAWHHGREIIHTSSKPALMVGSVLLFFLFFPLFLRSSAAFSKAKQACVNIYEQQYQMGQFLRRFYDKNPVAANDIGAVAYYSNGYVLDLWGLANIDIARSRKRGYWTPTFLESMVTKNNAKIAIVYDSWFDTTLLKQWTKVATWQIRNNVICGDDVVSFYATDSLVQPSLKRNLILYQPLLPAGVIVEYPPF